MRGRWLFVVFLLFPFVASAQEPLTYRLHYAASGDPLVHVSLTVPGGQAGPLTLIVPRNLPGGYGWRPYDGFIEHVQAFSAAGVALEVQRASGGPRWSAGNAGERVARVEYDVNIAQMEREILDAVDSSRVRAAYASLLGYSVFAYPEGLEEKPIRLRIEGPANWPVFTTLNPRLPADLGATTADAPNYYTLADSQILMGPDLQLRRLDGRVPLFLAVYAETAEDLDEEGKLAREALDRVSDYFKESPLPHYTVHVELLRPVSDRHSYFFSQEHVDSGSFSLGNSRAISRSSTPEERETNRFNYAHHIAHSWVPKQVYGTGYLPFLWEIPPLIDTIWFNEGFGRYAAIAALASTLPQADAEKYRRGKLDDLRQALDHMPKTLRKMSLVDLSRAGSFIYTDDFRVAQILFGRGALMAAEMDDRIRARTQGKKSFRDAFASMLEWSRTNHRGFRIEELPGIISGGTGVDVGDILKRWLEPTEP
jgi:predicted metalloprotease with PDZ domain